MQTLTKSSQVGPRRSLSQTHQFKNLNRDSLPKHLNKKRQLSLIFQCQLKSRKLKLSKHQLKPILPRKSKRFHLRNLSKRKRLMMSSIASCKEKQVNKTLRSNSQLNRKSSPQSPVKAKEASKLKVLLISMTKKRSKTKRMKKSMMKKKSKRNQKLSPKN